MAVNPKLIIDALMKLFGGAKKQVPMDSPNAPRTLPGNRANTDHPDFDPGEFYGGNLPERRGSIQDRRRPLEGREQRDDLNYDPLGNPSLPLPYVDNVPRISRPLPDRRTSVSDRRTTRPSDVDQIRPDLPRRGDIDIIDELIMEYVRVFKRSPTPAQIRNPRDMANAITDHQFINDPRSRMMSHRRQKNPDNSPVTLTPDDFDDIPF